MLHRVNVALQEDVTLIVGRNNSGKTSLSEAFHKFYGEKRPVFEFEDFSVASHKKGETDAPTFENALEEFSRYVAAKAGGESEESLRILVESIQNQVPRIKVELHIEYETGEGDLPADDLASLQRFIMDLDPDRKDAIISAEYSVPNVFAMFEEYDELIESLSDEDDPFHDFIDFIRNRFRRYYSINYFAVDLQNSANRRPVQISDIHSVCVPEFIRAQRDLDNQSQDNRRKLSRAFESFFVKLTDEDDNVKQIEELLRSFAEGLDIKYSDLFEGIFRDLREFGIGTGINLQEIKVKAQFEAARILSGNTKLFYSDTDQNLLPESYNGLGFSNLIYIILQFITFYEDFAAREQRPDFQVIFVEEPEAHFHPQMQQVFIRNIREFILNKEDWNVQIIISTHSSHIIAESGFECIRYFDNSDDQLVVRNLMDFQESVGNDRPETLKFLRRYMSVNNCDMFFADKIILVEGTVERLLLREIIRKIAPGLLSQYLSVIEVGGAHAANFKELLEFIHVATLIITDIDSVEPESKEACPATSGKITSNATLKSWLPGMEDIDGLLSLSDNSKEVGKIRVAYQVPEEQNGKCGRSFEEALIIKNPAVFGPLEGTGTYPRLFRNLGEEELVEQSYQIASKIKKKADFAYDMLGLEGWEIPRYIVEGLVWLEGNNEELD